MAEFEIKQQKDYPRYFPLAIGKSETQDRIDKLINTIKENAKYLKSKEFIELSLDEYQPRKESTPESIMKLVYNHFLKEGIRAKVRDNLILIYKL